jgi:hypothetical protein
MTDSTDNARRPELKPCPFCGAKDSLVTHTVARGVYVECAGGCGAWGPDPDNGDWNIRRADLAHDPLADPRVKLLETRTKEAVETLRKGFKSGDPTTTAAAIILAIAQLEGHGE